MSTTDVGRMNTRQTSSTEEEQGRFKGSETYVARRNFGTRGDNSAVRKCMRCSGAFGRFYNTGTSCPRCGHRVCRQCRIEIGTNSTDWLCNFCHKIEELHTLTWIHDGNKGTKSASPVEIIKRTIRRAWTINGPPNRWTAVRESVEYRSLPSRRRENSEDTTDNAKLNDTAEEDVLKFSTAASRNLTRNESNERLKKIEKQEESGENQKNSKKGEKPANLFFSNQSSPRVSFLKPPKIVSKLNPVFCPDIKSGVKYGERKSNIPVFRRNSKEFEDIGTPQESPKRSLIPQRYRGSSDDLRRSREDVSVPSLIPKLLSPRNKDEKLKRQDSKDDVRGLKNIVSVPIRKESKEETKITNEEEKTQKIDSTPEINVVIDTKESKEKGLRVEIVDEVANEKIEVIEVEEAVESPVLGTLESEEVEEENQELRESIRNMKEEHTQENGIDVLEKEDAGQRIEDTKTAEIIQTRKSEEFQVIRRKFSKEEFSNPDDTDDTPNKRCSSHLSPEVSPLSTRSSRYSPRESESEPTPALPRKTGDSSSASQRIREAISRTRRESNGSGRYESSGSESVRLSESGLHGYADLARRAKLFGSAITSNVGCDEVIQRDSATSAGEDEPHDDIPGRTISSQGRSMLRRRRQFDIQGSRRKGRSHARTCCGEDLQSLQTLHVLGRQSSPTQEQPIVDYRRLVFISSDSSSGREEDDADSSCSSSSYLNGLPRGNQGLEDCDWDYFESGSLPPLPPVGSAISNVGIESSIGNQDWSCCPGRGSSACQACGGSRGANVLPVPVPIPVPVPYPVPVPASLWTGDFVAAAAATSSMIGRGNEAETGNLHRTPSLRGDPVSWFAWHPRFAPQSLRIDPRTGSTTFDPITFTFRPEPTIRIDCRSDQQSVDGDTNIENRSGEDKTSTKIGDVGKEVQNLKEEEEVEQELKETEEEINDNDNIEEKGEIENNNDEEIHKFDDSGTSSSSRSLVSSSSSGRSSADSSDLEDSATHARFSRVFVVNDDSLTSDNDIEDNEEEDDDSDSPRDASNTNSKRSQGELPEGEPIILRHVKLIDSEIELRDSYGRGSVKINNDGVRIPSSKGEAESRAKKNHEDKELPSLPSRRERSIFDELYVADSDTGDTIELKSIKTLDPDSIEPELFIEKELNATKKDDAEKEDGATEESQSSENSPILRDSNVSDDSIVVPDSLEVSVDLLNIQEETLSSNSKITEDEINGSSSSNETNISSDELHEYEVNPEISINLSSASEADDANDSGEEEEDAKGGEEVVKNDGVAEKNAEKLTREGNVGDIITHKIQEIFKNVDPQAHDESAEVRGNGIRGHVVDGGGGHLNSIGGDSVEKGATRFRSVERRPPTRKENGFPPNVPTKDSNFPSTNNRYKSLVMITQGTSYQPVSVVTSDTTTLLPADESQSLAGYFHLTLESCPTEQSQLQSQQQQQQQSQQSPNRRTRRPVTVKRMVAEPEADSGLSVGSASESEDVHSKTRLEENSNQQQQQQLQQQQQQQSQLQGTDENRVILEEGLADDDSWVEEVSHDEDAVTEESSEDETNNLGDREEELRGYHRQAIDFTLHTIVEESCEESEAEPLGNNLKRPPSASELEKYFFFGLGGENGNGNGNREPDSLSETSSIYSEGLESLGQEEGSPGGNGQNSGNSNEGSSRLEKYFLSEFLGFDRRDSDGSVGSDSEGRPSPEAQRRKRLVRARGTGRSHSSSLDNLLALTQNSQNSSQDACQDNQTQETQSEGSSTETDGADEAPVFGTEGQFDTVKRKKKKPRNLGTQSPRVPDDRNKTPEPQRDLSLALEQPENEQIDSEDSERAKTPQPENSSSNQQSSSLPATSCEETLPPQRIKQQSRDSGFVGSCDDLLQNQKSPEENILSDKTNRSENREEASSEGMNSRGIPERTGNRSIPPNASLSRKDSFNNWSSDEETNLMMSKMRQFFKTMVANSGQNNSTGSNSGVSPSPSPRLPGYSSKSRLCPQNRTKPPQLVYFENELTRLMKTVPGIRDEQVREIVEYLSSEDTWSDSYDSSDYTSSDLESAGANGRRSALQEQISQSCRQIISKFDTTSNENGSAGATTERNEEQTQQYLGKDTAFVYQKLVQSFTKMTGDSVSSDTSSTPRSSPPLIAKVMHHIGSRLVALMHEVSEGGPQPTTWKRYSQHHRTPSSASTTEDDDSTSDSTNAPPLQPLPRSKSHDPLLLINNAHAATAGTQDGEEREASDYERFSWRGSFESALMAADSRTKLGLLACSGDVNVSTSASALAIAAKRRSAGDLLFEPKTCSREQLDRVRSCGSIGGGGGGSIGASIEERIWSNRRRSSVPDANTRGESGASAGDDDTEDEFEYGVESRATTLPREMQVAAAATNSLPRLPASTISSSISSSVLASSTTTTTSTMHKTYSLHHFLPQHSGVKSARYRPPGFARNSGNVMPGPKRAMSAPGLQVTGNQSSANKRDRNRRQQAAVSLTTASTRLMEDDGSSLSEACSTPIIGAGSRMGSGHTALDIDDCMDRGLNSGRLATRASLSSLGARSDSMASVYSGAGEGRWCGSVAVRGEVEFALQYDYKQLTFEVHVTQCRGLAPVDIKRDRSDPYVKVYLLPDKSKSGKRKTKVKKHTLSPVFNETLKFHTSLNGLEARTLWLTVWHSDMFGRNDFLGEVRMPLENKIFDDPTPHWYPLQERTEPFDDPVSYKGEVIVGLKFVPPDPAQQQEKEREMGGEHRSKARKNWSRGALHVLVKEARSLQTRAKNSGTCDPFCKSYLLPDKGRSGKQKTGVVRRSDGSPVWNHTFIYKDVSLQELAERGLELTVWDHDRIASNEFLGGVRFNLGTGKHYGKVVDWMDATGRELSLWQSMLERPNFWVESAVTLRPNLHNHGKSNSSM